MEPDIQHSYRGGDSSKHLVGLHAARPECSCAVRPGDEDLRQGTCATSLGDPQLVVE